MEAMKKFKLDISEDRIWKFIAQFFIALSVMNKDNLAHRDIKDSNILIDKNDNIKVSDYGVSKKASLDSMKFNTLQIGTMFMCFIYLFVYLFIQTVYGS
jgi:serine/threonine protein kinase